MMLALPLEKYAPYFGDANTNIDRYGTLHSHNDMGIIANQNGIPVVTPGGTLWCDDSQPLQQASVDGFNFDPRYIPQDAAKHAIYGPTEIALISWWKARDTTLLEQIVASDKEVDLGLGLGESGLRGCHVLRRNARADAQRIPCLPLSGDSEYDV